MHTPDPTLYQRVGGADGIAALVDRIYYWMERLPQAEVVRTMHPRGFDEVKARLRAFLSGWFGGPQEFHQKYGEPFMRRRHFPFAIDSSARDGWMACLQHALEDCIPDPALRQQLDSLFFAMADHLRNRADVGGPGTGAGHAGRGLHPMGAAHPGCTCGH